MKFRFSDFKTSPKTILSTVMMHVRFPFSVRQVEDLFHERVIGVS
jgi:putative transposase